MTSSVRGRGRSISSMSAMRPGRARHHHHAVGEEHRLAGRMGDEHHGLAPLEPDALQLDVHRLAGERVERAERLVHQQQRRIVDQRAHQRDALLHAARQLPRVAVLETGQADQRDQRRARAAIMLLAAEPLHVDRQQRVAEHAAPGKQHRRLEHHADVAARAVDRRAVEQRLAAESPASGRRGFSAAWTCRSRTGRRSTGIRRRRR